MIHQHLLIAGDGGKFRDIDHFKQILRETVAAIGMKLAPITCNPNGYECQARGNEGITAVAIIETSHLIVHSWFGHEGDRFQIDIYSCAPFSVPETLAFLTGKFRLVQCRYRLIDRNNL